MFSKDRKDGAPAEPAARRQSGIPALLSAGLEFTGDIAGNGGEIQIDGSLAGDVQCGKLIIGDEGEVRGAVTTGDCVVLGKLVGQIDADTVTLAASARVEGEIRYGTLSIELGATFEGYARQRERAGQEQPRLEFAGAGAAPEEDGDAA